MIVRVRAGQYLVRRQFDAGIRAQYAKIPQAQERGIVRRRQQTGMGQHIPDPAHRSRNGSCAGRVRKGPLHLRRECREALPIDAPVPHAQAALPQRDR